MNDNHSRNGIKHLCHKRCGLMVGKPVGITLFSWLVTRTGKARLPEGVTWPQLLAVSAVAGVSWMVAAAA